MADLVPDPAARDFDCCHHRHASEPTAREWAAHAREDDETGALRARHDQIAREQT